MPRFNRRGKTKVYLVQTIADPAAPTVGEIEAGVALHPVLRSYTGFTSEKADLDAADQSSDWNKTIPGGETPASSSLTLYAGDDVADDEEDVRTEFTEDDEVYVVWCLWGVPVEGEPANVFPVRIKAINDDSMTDQVAGTYTVGASIYDPPNKYVAIAAGS